MTEEERTMFPQAGPEMAPSHEPKEEEEEEEDEEEDFGDELADLAEGADDKVDALINLLVKKGMISHDEYDKEYDDLFEEDEPETPTRPTDQNYLNQG